jgi:hypothetical protein
MEQAVVVTSLVYGMAETDAVPTEQAALIDTQWLVRKGLVAVFVRLET